MPPTLARAENLESSKCKVVFILKKLPKETFIEGLEQCLV